MQWAIVERVPPWALTTNLGNRCVARPEQEARGVLAPTNLGNRCVARPEQEAKGVRAAHALRLLLRVCHISQKLTVKLVR